MCQKHFCEPPSICVGLEPILRTVLGFHMFYLGCYVRPTWYNTDIFTSSRILFIRSSFFIQLETTHCGISFWINITPYTYWIFKFGCNRLDWVHPSSTRTLSYLYQLFSLHSEQNAKSFWGNQLDYWSRENYTVTSENILHCLDFTRIHSSVNSYIIRTYLRMHSIQLYE